MRSKALGMMEHPVVVIDHPIASKPPEAVQKMALASIKEVTQGLVSPSS